MTARTGPGLEQAILDTYRRTGNLTRTARECRTSRTNVTVVLRRHHVTVGPPGKPRQYRPADDAFHRLDPQTAYWLGLLRTRGGIDRATDRVRLGLPRTDADTLDRFHAFVGTPDRPLVRYSADGLAATVRSRRVVADLRRWGVVPRADRADEPVPDSVTREPAFWLGVLDGTGTAGFRRTPTGPVPAVQLVGDDPLMRQAARFLARLTPDVSLRRLRRRHDDLAVETSGTGAQAVLRELLRAVPVSTARVRSRAQAALRWDAGT